MSGDFGNDFITIMDEDGVEIEMEHLDTFDIDGRLYMCFLPADMDEDDENYGVMIFKVITEDGEEILYPVDDDDELERAFDIYLERQLDEDDD